jgi:hypothetical protein
MSKLNVAHDKKLTDALAEYGRVMTIFIIIKEQCHEMVIERRPWSSRVGLN